MAEDQAGRSTRAQEHGEATVNALGGLIQSGSAAKPSAGTGSAARSLSQLQVNWPVPLAVFNQGELLKGRWARHTASADPPSFPLPHAPLLSKQAGGATSEPTRLQKALAKVAGHAPSKSTWRPSRSGTVAPQAVGERT